MIGLILLATLSVAPIETRPTTSQCLALIDEMEVKKGDWDVEYIAALEDVADCFKQVHNRGRYVHRWTTSR